MTSKLGITAHHAGYIVSHDGIKAQFETIEEAETYMDSNGLEVSGDDRIDYTLHEWPEGLWLQINAWSADDGD